MNKFYTLLAALLITATTFAQSPESMSYQAVVRDGSDILVSNTTTPIQISILQGTTAVYVETQTPTTNANGLLSIEIGGSGATVVSGVFSDIIWSTDTYFIKTEVDVDNNGSYDVTGTSQFLSVPYALYARTSGSAKNAGLSNCNCSSYIIPYMPYSFATSPSIYISNVPASWLGSGTDTTSDISVEVMDEFGNIYDLGVIGSLAPTQVTKIHRQIADGLDASGFSGTGKVAIRITLTNPEHAFVYASYDTGNGSVAYVKVECIR